ncbi:MAG: collagen-like protein, partial [Ruminiclostridium sp.]|nr:collagen-like protein [Ruminiclostridium sp.]
DGYNSMTILKTLAARDGTDGTNGTNGINGQPGANGLDGQDGYNTMTILKTLAARDGADGTNGTNGINGQPGANGLDGRSGETRYAPTVTVYGAGEVRLLPVYALDGIIFPAVPDRIPGMVRLNTAASAARNVSVHREDMPVLRDRSIKPAARQKTDEADTRTAAPAMNAETVMRYRDPITPEQNRQIPASADTPDRNELISRFGNLIEGADAVMNGSFRSGTGIGRETMAVIEQTAEKTALNSKMIEEIREQQRKLESVTLRSSDLDTISEELIRKLRSRMRLDRSRYAGQ